MTAHRGIGLVCLALVACSDSSKGPLGDVDSLVFLQRQARDAGLGNVFAYDSYLPGARVLKLSPPAADGELTTICCDQFPEFAEADIIAFDLSFDARSLVVSAKLSADSHYGLHLYHLDTGELETLPTDPNFDYVYPTFLPGDRIFFTTNAVVEEGAPQHRDEYERAVTLQAGSIAQDGSDLRLYSRNLSHRTTSTVLSTGEVMMTQWQHLTEQNDGHLLRMNPDGTRVREAFGSEGTGVANSYYKPVEISPGRIIAIASSRDMTFQSGAIVDIRLGKTYEADNGDFLADQDMSEVNASVQVLTEGVPLGEEPSFATIGRYYSAWPLDAGEHPNLVVSWADGPVQADVNGAAGVPPDFGLFLLDTRSGQRLPIYDAPDTWEISARPLAPRAAPPTIPTTGGHAFGDAVLLGNMNVYDSTLTEFEPGSIYGVRVIEGFSGEEGIGMDFGLTRSEGAASLGIAPVRDDGSWLALIPANVPVHQVVIDKYGMSLRQETVWISGNAGESRVCGGCHESRTGTTVIDPGLTDAVAFGPTDLMSTVARFDRKTTDAANPVGIAWDGPVQAIFDAKCVSCHEGTPGVNGNTSFTITDPDSGQSQTFTFDLRGTTVDIAVGEAMTSSYSISHLTLIGPDMLTEEDRNLVITGVMPEYVEPHDSRASVLLQKINPRRQFPAVDDNDRAFGAVGTHPADVGGTPLTAAEERILVEMVDNGAQFYSRENSPGLTY